VNLRHATISVIPFQAMKQNNAFSFQRDKPLSAIAL
jgi:hypothetical protein